MKIFRGEGIADFWNVLTRGRNGFFKKGFMRNIGSGTLFTPVIVKVLKAYATSYP